MVTFHLLTLPLSNKAIVNTSNGRTLIQGPPSILCVQVLCLPVELAQSALLFLNSKQVPVVENCVQHCNRATGIAQPLHLKA